MEHVSITESESAPISGIKVLDRSVLILQAVAGSPRTLAQLCEDTGLPRATTHRLASALEMHDFLSRDEDGRWLIGPGLAALTASQGDALIKAATPIMEDLMEQIGESMQLYRIAGTSRICVAAVSPASGLQNTVPVGTRLSLSAGSAARVFAAFSPAETRKRLNADEHFAAEDLDKVRSQGWAASFSEREAGLASVSVPVFNQAGVVVAALSVSGPDARFPRTAGEEWGPLLVAAATQLRL
ncbi:IclR family transcriptional regulator [Corynebacterium epidermidicanis]|uniref:Transcriptional regulator, IclR family n=1 Tax=Corynebacterium epidermidicanis TaxID=1050174 RepID=A0A0G3GP91_9CORY|nr:IclR family transcriptional regulator [Corynebacterium epidermidicanis]AKK02974.1 transcriptional regulator, IclR family [Corynebacterium epidermidicanis]